MRKLQNFLIPFAMMGILVLTTSYSDDSDSYYKYWNYVPVFMTRADLEKSVSYQPSGRDMENPGKIYYRHPYIYINEKYKGVHVINNSDPATPVNEGFIVAPGCLDMAIKGNIMYLDNAVDLVAFELEAKEVTERIREVFPEPVSPDNEVFYATNNRAEYILVAWKNKDD